ncbi:hypothetical protein C3L33_17146, partial [Rhododendron williamsianum]
GVRTLAKSPTFARDPRQLQFEADINRLFLYTSYNRLGRNADEKDAEEIIDMAGKASLADQQKQVQDNIHSQIKTFSTWMDEILLPDSKSINESAESNSQKNTQTAVALALLLEGQAPQITVLTAVPDTKPLNPAELSQKLKNLMGYTLELKPSQIPHNEAGRGLFIDGNLMWDISSVIGRRTGPTASAQDADKGSDRMWKMLSKPLPPTRVATSGDVLERRNPLALAHFANHPAKGMVPNVMVCPYDFPLTEKDMRTYIPNVAFGGGEEARMKRFGRFWFKSWGSGNSGSDDVPILKTLVLVATRALSDEEVLLNYRLSNSKRGRPGILLWMRKRIEEGGADRVALHVEFVGLLQILDHMPLLDYIWSSCFIEVSFLFYFHYSKFHI